MFIQIIVIIQNKTFRKQARVAPCAPCFLHIVFKRIGDIIMNNQLDVFFVNTHAERRGSNHDFYLVVDKRFLVCNLFIRVHFPVEWLCREAVACQLFRKLNRSSCARNVYDGWTILLLDQGTKRIVFFLIRFLEEDCVMQIFTIGCRCEKFKR